MISLLVVGPPFSTSSSSIIVIHKFSNLDMILRSYQIGNPLKHFGNGMCAWLVALPSNDQESKRWSSGDFSWISTGKVSVEVEG